MDNYEEKKYNQEDFYEREELAPVMKVSDWIIVYILMMIPLVNIILVFVFAFGSKNPNKANFFKAVLIVSIVLIALCFIVAILGWSAFEALINTY